MIRQEWPICTLPAAVANSYGDNFFDSNVMRLVHHLCIAVSLCSATGAIIVIVAHFVQRQIPLSSGM